MKPQEFLIWLTLISSLSILFAWGITSLGKTLSAAWQYFIWLLAILAPLVAIPLLVANLHLDVPLLPGEKREIANVAAAPLPAIASGQQSEATGDLLPNTSPSFALPAIVFLWAVIALAWIAYLGVEHVRMHRRLRRAEAINRESILGKMIAGLPIPYSLECIKTSGTQVPFCYGFIHPVIILPASAGEWDAEKLRACLLHESAHLKRGDLWFFALTQLSCAFCWFNPLIWLAASRIRNLAEIAADDLVVSKEMRPASYAASLLSVSESILDARFTTVAFSMLRPANLKSRLEHVLDDTAWRETPQRLPMALASVTLILLLTVATSVRLVAANEDQSSPAPQTPGSQAKDKSEIVTETRVTKNITLQAMLIGMPTTDAAEFSSGHDLVRQPAEALAALQRLVKESHAAVVSMPALVVRAGEPVYSTTTAGTTELIVTQALVEPDGKSLQLRVIVKEQDAHQLSSAITAKNDDTVFLGTISGVKNPSVTEFAFLHISVVDHESKIENLIPTKAEMDTLTGQWVNPSPDGAGLNRLLISRVGSELVIQGWGMHAGKEYDWGQTKLHVENQYNAQWKSDFGTLFIRFTKEGNQLTMEAFASVQGKENRRSYLVFQKGT